MRRRRWPGLLLLALFVLILVPYLEILQAIWLGSGSRASASLVAFVGSLGTGILAYRRTAPGVPRHVPAAIAALLVMTLGYVASVSFEVIVGMGLTTSGIFSILLYLSGGRALCVGFRYSLALFVLAIPTPGFALDALTHGMLLSATAIIAEMLSWVLADVVVDGFHVSFQTGSIAIVNSCSGMRGTLLFLPLTVILASLFRPIRPIVLVGGIVFAVILAFVTNLVRIFTTAMLVHWGQTSGTSGFAHEALGAILLLGSIAVLFWYFHRFSNKGAGEASRIPSPAGQEGAGAEGSRSFGPVGAASVLGVGCVVLLLQHSLGTARQMDLSVVEREIRSAFDGVEFDSIRFDNEELLPDDYLCLIQSDAERPFFSVYVGYFPRRGLTEKSQHDPRICYGTQGWNQAGPATRLILDTSDGQEIEIQRLVFDSEGARRIVWFWVEKPEVTSEAGLSSWKELLARRSDSAWIRIELDSVLEGPEWIDGWGDLVAQLKYAVSSALH